MTETARSEKPLSAKPAQHLLQFVRLCKASAKAIRTDDQATMDEIEKSLAIAEIAVLRLLSGFGAACEDEEDIVDLDEF